jgi:hypothetical protein
MEDAKNGLAERIGNRVGVPPIAMAGEYHQDFDEFFRTSPLRELVQQKLLNRTRRLCNANWHPTGVLSGGAWAIHNRAKAIMSRIWRTRTTRFGV